MINLDFEVDKINILIRFLNVKNSLERSSDRGYPTEFIKNNEFFKLLNNREKLFQLLSKDELMACKNALIPDGFKHGNRRESFFEILCSGGYEEINSDNYMNVFSTCLTEYQTYGDNYKLANDMAMKMPSLQSAISKLINTPEFETLYQDAINYKNHLEKIWNENKDNISTFVENAVGKEANYNSKVMVQPPYYDEGVTDIYHNGDIAFSQCRDNNKKNQDTLALTYLTHESMHSSILPYKETQSKESRKNLHGFIQYLIDNELCSKLLESKGIEYQYGQNMQHDIDETDFFNMYPFFVGYLNRNNKDVVQAIKDNMRKNIGFSARKDVDGKLVPLYSPEKIAKFFSDKKDMTPYDLSELDFDKAKEMFEFENGRNSKREDYDER